MYQNDANWSVSDQNPKCTCISIKNNMLQNRYISTMYMYNHNKQQVNDIYICPYMYVEIMYVLYYGIDEKLHSGILKPPHIGRFNNIIDRTFRYISPNVHVYP